MVSRGGEYTFSSLHSSTIEHPSLFALDRHLAGERPWEQLFEIGKVVGSYSGDLRQVHG